MTITVNPEAAHIAEAFGEFTPREVRTIADYERDTAAIDDTLDCADDSNTYQTAAGEHGLQYALDLCRAHRGYLAEWAEAIEALHDQLRLDGQGRRIEPSEAANRYLKFRSAGLESLKVDVEGAILDYLLGPVDRLGDGV